jgi:hypothetical protein
MPQVMMLSTMHMAMLLFSIIIKDLSFDVFISKTAS